jgi:hypothetical protein
VAVQLLAPTALAVGDPDHPKVTGLETVAAIDIGELAQINRSGDRSGSVGAVGITSELCAGGRWLRSWASVAESALGRS